MKHLNAIVVLTQCEPGEVAVLGEIERACPGIVQHISILDKNDIAAMLVKSELLKNVHTDSAQMGNVIGIEGVSKDDLALALIGKRYENELMRGNLLDFITKLATDVTVSKYSGANQELLRALKTLGEDRELSISKEVRKKYHVTDTALARIVKIAKHVENAEFCAL